MKNSSPEFGGEFPIREEEIHKLSNDVFRLNELLHLAWMCHNGKELPPHWGKDLNRILAEVAVVFHTVEMRRRLALEQQCLGVPLEATHAVEHLKQFINMVATETQKHQEHSFNLQLDTKSFLTLLISLRIAISSESRTRMDESWKKSVAGLVTQFLEMLPETMPAIIKSINDLPK